MNNYFRLSKLLVWAGAIVIPGKDSKYSCGLFSQNYWCYMIAVASLPSRRLNQVFLVQGSETMCTQLGKKALFTQQELLMVELGPTVSFTIAIHILTTAKVVQTD